MTGVYRSALSFQPPDSLHGHAFPVALGQTDGWVCHRCGVPFGLLFTAVETKPGIRKKDPPRLVRVRTEESWCAGAVLALEKGQP